MRVYWTDFARSGLREIYRYYQRKASIKVANRIKAEIFQKVSRLAVQAHLGSNEPNLEETGLNYRYLVSGNFKIIYLIQGDSVFVTDIFDTRQDPQKINKPR